ncbi:putative membrane protein At1g16860 isoform X2 [Curcuma longa]|uniref:putative membrane protein At1g16860 isoform X2 n=1 Tax=Curcuma longa TaxID=136217 RepID=UPI003D9DBFA7
MGSRFQSHQLSNGLYVSGRPEQPKEKPPTICSTAMPYTGGDIKKSGELGKMFELHVEKSRKSAPLNNAPSRNRSFGGTASNSGPIMPNASGQASYSSSLSYAGQGSGSSLVTGGSGRQKSNSGPLKHGDSVKKSSGPQSGSAIQTSRQNSGSIPVVLPTTGLITSGPISSGPLNSSGVPRKISGPQESTKSMKLNSGSMVHNQAVTNLSQENNYLFKGSLPKPILWSVVLLFVMGFIAGGFILGAVHNPVLLLVVVAIFGVVVVLSFWNTCVGRRAVLAFIAQYPDADLRNAKDGQYVKVVTCGNFPLESSYHKVPRCVYTSTGLYEYKGWDSKNANSEHRRFTWGLRSMERHVVDFYISDFQSGLRALVKAGYGSQVTPYVDESVVVEINPNNKDLSPEFLRWLQERNLSCDDHVMRLKEGYVKEGSTVSIMGVVRKNENVLMIVPPPEPFSTGCQWTKCVLPANLDGLILRCEDTSNVDVIPV